MPDYNGLNERELARKRKHYAIYFTRVYKIMLEIWKARKTWLVRFRISAPRRRPISRRCLARSTVYFGDYTKEEGRVPGWMYNNGVVS